MKDAIEEIIEICEKIRKISELKGEYPENVSKKVEQEFKLKLKEIASKIEIDFTFLSQELEKIENEIELTRREIKELENSLKGIELRYLIGEIKETEKERKTKQTKKEIEKLREKEESLLKEKERIERIIKGGYEVAREESKIFKVSFEEIPAQEEMAEKEREEIPIAQEESLSLEREEEPAKWEEIQEVKPEPAFELSSFSFEEEKKEEKVEDEAKPFEEIEKKEELAPEKELSEERFQFSPMETIGYTPEKKEDKEDSKEEEKTSFVSVPYLVIKTLTGERKFLLSEGKNTVGRSPDCNIVINEKGISREHFAIHVKGDVFTIEDLGSKNGTFLNGKKIKSAELKNGDEVIAGECTMFFEFG